MAASREVGVGNRTFYASLEVTPAGATVPAGGSVEFTAVVRDAYGFSLPDARPEWEVVYGPGTSTRPGCTQPPPASVARSRSAR